MSERGMEANARLIAAAPELLDLVECFVNLAERDDDAAYRERDEVRDEARGLLARIQGEG